MSVIAVVGVGAAGGTIAAHLYAADLDEVILCVRGGLIACAAPPARGAFTPR